MKAKKLSVMYGSLQIAIEPVFELLFQWFNISIKAFFGKEKNAAWTWKTFLLKLLFHAYELNVLNVVSYDLPCHVNSGSEQNITFYVIECKNWHFLTSPYLKILLISTSTVNKKW